MLIVDKVELEGRAKAGDPPQQTSFRGVNVFWVRLHAAKASKTEEAGIERKRILETSAIANKSSFLLASRSNSDIAVGGSLTREF
jgi:hypothetical protein